MSKENPISILEFIKLNYPNKDPKAVFSSILAKEVYGPLPEYSNRHDYQILPVTTMLAGAFAVLYYSEADRKSNDIHKLKL